MRSRERTGGVEALSVNMILPREWRDAVQKAASDFGLCQRDFVAEMTGMALYEMGYIDYADYYERQAGRAYDGRGGALWEASRRRILQEREREEPYPC